jgi:hypothetical protein
MSVFDKAINEQYALRNALIAVRYYNWKFVRTKARGVVRLICPENDSMWTTDVKPHLVDDVTEEFIINPFDFKLSEYWQGARLIQFDSNDVELGPPNYYVFAAYALDLIVKLKENKNQFNLVESRTGGWTAIIRNKGAVEEDSENSICGITYVIAHVAYQAVTNKKYEEFCKTQ